MSANKKDGKPAGTTTEKPASTTPAGTTTQEEEAVQAQSDEPNEPKRSTAEGKPMEGDLLGNGAAGAAIGGLLGGAGGAAIGGVLGLMRGAVWGDGKKKRSGWW